MMRLRRLCLLMVAALWATAARADERPLMRAVLLPGLIPNVVQQMVPMTVEASGARLQIIGMVYCGSDGDGGANAVGIVSPEQNAPAAPMLSSADCEEPLSAISRRAIKTPGAPDWVEAIKARATWIPWQLRLDLVESAGAAKPGSSAPSLAGLRQLGSYPTSNLKILPPPGDRYRFDAAVAFAGSRVIVAIFAAGRTANPEAFLTSDASLGAEISGAPGANVIADAQYPFINAMLAIYAPQYEVPIEVQGMTQTMVARNVRVAGGEDMMTATGQLSLGDIAYNSAVHCVGNDLTISQITLEPLVANCDGDDVIERLKCQGQQAALAGSSNAVAAALTNYYQGQNFHYSAVAHPLRFTIGEQDYLATFEAMKSSSRGSTVSEAGRVTLRRTSE